MLLRIFQVLLPLHAYAPKHNADPLQNGCSRYLRHVMSISCPELVRMPPQRQVSECFLIGSLADLPQQRTTVHRPAGNVLVWLQQQSCCSFKNVLLIGRPGNPVCPKLAAMIGLNLLPPACKHLN